MKIIILGAGQVGGTLAEHLANEQNDITVVDTDGEKLRALQDRLDIGTVAGGLVHAVAYGLIFDALGRSLVLTLSRHGELVPGEAVKEFEEGISEHIEAGVRRVARLALEEKTGGD